MKYLILGLVSLVLFTNCSKEEITNYEATLINKSIHNISIYIYSNGAFYPKDTINLLPNKSFLYGRGYDRGLVYPGRFNSFYPNKDSVVVSFNNTYKVKHYIYSPLTTSGKFYDYSSTRNFMNINSYKVVITKTSKQSLFKEHFYEFTEADYIFASQ